MKKRKKTYRSSKEIARLKNDSNFLVGFREFADSQELSDCMSVVFDQFKRLHSSNNLVPHIHQHNQQSINAVREFMDLFMQMGMDDPNQEPEDDDTKPDLA